MLYMKSNSRYHVVSNNCFRHFTNDFFYLRKTMQTLYLGNTFDLLRSAISAPI